MHKPRPLERKAETGNWLEGCQRETVQSGQASRRRQHGSPGAIGGTAWRAHTAGGPGSPLGAGSGPEDRGPGSPEGSPSLQGSQPQCQWHCPQHLAHHLLLGGALGLGFPEADPETRVPGKQLVCGEIPGGKWGLRRGGGRPLQANAVSRTLLVKGSLPLWGP